ncbi:MAG: hypothetical protein PF541_03155 [Prolixibacteraceae bacterium]|jgi:hypothetical protein|nr:hypothetical protein [Prolixibacteraceae bacterium]
MNTDSQDKNKRNSFEYKLREVSDEEIISILQYRDHFQAQAVKAALKEALKRGIISDISDLDKEEFQPKPLASRSLFPLGNTEMQNIAIFKSLCRIFYGFGLLPIIFGFIQISKHITINSIAAIVTGIVIIFIANR